MPNSKNKDIVKGLIEKLSQAKSVIFTEYKGLNANEISQLRESMGKFGAEVSIQRNTLLKVALSETTEVTEAIKGDLVGQIAVIIAQEDAISPLKALVKFAADNEKELPKIKAGLISGTYVTADEVKLYSELPAKEVLVAKLLGALKSPITGVVNVLNGSQRKLVYAFAAIADKKEVS